MARTGSDYKGSWSGWEEHSRMLYNCPCCEFTKDEDGGIQCELCPLLDYWLGGPVDVNESSRCRCTRRGSPFKSWETARTPEARSKYARIIAGFPKAELEKLGGINED